MGTLALKTTIIFLVVLARRAGPYFKRRYNALAAEFGQVLSILIASMGGALLITAGGCAVPLETVAVPLELGPRDVVAVGFPIVCLDSG